MSQFYILVEGVNIYANMLDTNQLSVMRGSSFILKDAIDEVTKKPGSTLEAISTGASSGLYCVKNDSNTKGLVKKQVKEISKLLNDPEKEFSLLTFIVVSCEADNLLIAKEKLYTKLRIQQMQSISQTPDKTENTNYLNHPDELEGRRIAAKGDENKLTLKDKNINLSESVIKRFRYGQKKKQDFYFDDNTKNQLKANKNEEETNEIDETIKRISKNNFCNDFEELAKNQRYRKLNNKIAVIYMDGNNFSKKQREYIQRKPDNSHQVEAQKYFDTYIQRERANLIYQLLKDMDDEGSDYFQNAITENDKIRLETLLWGGDESIFVVPAWLGFELLQRIFVLTKNWKLDNTSLTHAAGLIFCSYKTPIKNIRSIAQAIADEIKEVENKEKGKDGRAQNAWNYMVLESIDYPSNNSIKAFNQSFYKETLANSKPEFIPASTDWDTIKPLFNQLINKRLLPKRQLYRLVNIIYENQEESKSDSTLEDLAQQTQSPELSLQEKQEHRLLQVSENKEILLKILPQISNFFNIDIDHPATRKWLWIYLFDLWDYIVPVTEEKDTQGEDDE